MRSTFVAIAIMLGIAATAGADVGRPWIGIALAQGTSGVRITEVIDETPGKRAGLLADDEVLAIDGVAVTEPHGLIDLVGKKGIGTKVDVSVMRAGQRVTFSLALEPRPEALELLKKHLLGKPAPDFALAEAVGTTPANLAKLKGHVVVLEFWATWCGFCHDTRPTLSALQHNYAASGVRVLGVSSDDVDELRRVSVNENLPFTIARDPHDKVAATYYVPGLPTFVVIDKAGVVRYVTVGAGPGFDAIEPTVKKLLQ